MHTLKQSKFTLVSFWGASLQKERASGKVKGAINNIFTLVSLWGYFYENICFT